MKKQKGFSLIILLVALAIIVFLGTQTFRTTGKMTGDDKSGFEQQIETIQQAEDIKEILEEKSKSGSEIE